MKASYHSRGAKLGPQRVNLRRVIRQPRDTHTALQLGFGAYDQTTGARGEGGGGGGDREERIEETRGWVERADVIKPT